MQVSVAHAMTHLCDNDVVADVNNMHVACYFVASVMLCSILDLYAIL
jgi:hypothetical protein